MKKIILLCLVASLWAIDFKNTQMSFVQSITNDENKTIKYSGKVFVDEDKIVWRYQKPIEKDVYFANNRIIVIEKELEQASVFTSEKEGFNLFEIYKRAKILSPNHRQITIDKKLINIFSDKILRKISYKDELENDVQILFSSPTHKKMPRDFFKPKIPKHFDVIYE